MKYRMITIEDLESVYNLWNEFANEEDNVYKTMNIDEISSKFISHEDYNIVSIGVFQDQELIGFSSGNYQEGKDTAYITCVIIQKQYRRHGIGKILLEKLETDLLSKNIAKFDIVFFNPVRFEWIIPGTKTCDHPGTPGVDMNSDEHPFYLHCGYKDYVYQYTYYKDIRDYGFSKDITEKLQRLNKNGITVEYYDSETHYGFDSLFEDLKSEGWRQAIQTNLDKEDSDPILIAHRDGEICGFTGPLRKQDSLRGYFAGIGIHSNCRGLGAGRVLFAFLCKGLKELGAEYMTFFTGNNNPARNIYEKEGFKVVRTWANMRKIN